MKQASLNAMERDLQVILDEATGPEASKLLAKTWREAHGEVVAAGVARGGVAPDYDVAVDNQKGKSVDTAERIIVSIYDYRREVVDFAMEALIKASPKRSGAYVKGHSIYVNGKPVGQSCPPLKETDKVFIANVMPYARRLEIGRTKSGRSFVIQVPNRIYERTAKTIVTPLYRRIVTTSFNYVDLSGAHIIKGGLGATYKAEGERVGVGPGKPVVRKRRQKVGEKVRYPAIFFEAVD